MLDKLLKFKILVKLLSSHMHALSEEITSKLFYVQQGKSDALAFTLARIETSVTNRVMLGL